MSIEVLRAEFDAYKNECAKDRNVLSMGIKEAMNTMDTKISVILVALDNKVSFKHFYWIIGTLVGIQSAIFGAAFWLLSSQMSTVDAKVADLNKTSSSVQADVSFLRGKLSPFDVQYTK